MSKAAWRIRATFASALSLALAAGGCMQAVRTSTGPEFGDEKTQARAGLSNPEDFVDAIAPGAPHQPGHHIAACANAHGGYYLPRARIHVALAKENDGARAVTLERASDMAADTSRMYCLDYLASPLSSDMIAVSRTADGLLTAITSAVEDRTPQIVENLAETAKNLTLAAARGLTTDAAPGDTLDIVFDPFDPGEFALAQKALVAFHACVSIDDGVCKEHRPSGKGKGTEKAYVETTLAQEVLVDETARDHAMRDGVLYRPLAPVKVTLHRSIKASGRLLPTHSAYFEMPNASPIMAIKIDRALFTTRKTEVLFDKGVLTSVRLSKGSELEGFVRIPLAIVTAATSIPGELVTLRISDANNRAALIDAQGKLMNALATLQTARTGGRALTGRAFSNCLDGLGSARDCSRALGGLVQ